MAGGYANKLTHANTHNSICSIRCAIVAVAVHECEEIYAQTNKNGVYGFPSVMSFHAFFRSGVSDCVSECLCRIVNQSDAIADILLSFKLAASGASGSRSTR